MTTSPQVLTAACKACLDLVLTQCQLLIHDWCDTLSILLITRSSREPEPTERRLLLDAVKSLRSNQYTIEQQFKAALGNAIENETQLELKKNTATSKRSLSALNFDELEMMNEHQVQQKVRNARLLQIISDSCEQGLSSMVARLSTAQGFKVVMPEKNPLRPHVVLHALLKLLENLPVDDLIRSRWLMLGAQSFGLKLQNLYVSLNELLEKLSIEPAPYFIISLHNDQTLTPPETHKTAGTPFGTKYLTGAAQPGTEGFASYDKKAQVAATVDESGRKNLEKLLANEVVRLLIEHLSHDSRILAPVRQVLANIEPELLRLGIMDPGFLSDKNHRVRRLLETMVADSLTYATEDAPGFAGFMQTVREIANFLGENQLLDAHQYALFLQDLENKLSSHQPEIMEAQNRAVQVLLYAEQRNVLAKKIAFEILARTDFFHGNGIITAFITGPWAQVMALERLKSENGSMGSPKAVFGPALGDLLWSINEQYASRHHRRLNKLIPSLLTSLREGLLTIDYPLVQSKVFFDELMRIHRAILKAVPGQAEKRDNFQQAFSAADQIKNWTHGNKLWLAPTEAQQSGFMNFDDEDKVRGFELTVPGPLSAYEPIAHHAQPSSDESVDLQLGAWVELMSGTIWLPAQLTWISPYNTLFMFTSAGGVRHSMTVQMFKQLITQNRLKIVI